MGTSSVRKSPLKWLPDINTHLCNTPWI